MPGFSPKPGPETGDWRAELPAWLIDQRNQMTGPASDSKLVVAMANSGSPGVMLDGEDSVNYVGAGAWENVRDAHLNAAAALLGTLEFQHPKKGLQRIEPADHTVVFHRLRGLHLHQELPDGRIVSASIFDAALHLYLLREREELRHDPCIYIPKSELASEGKWWNELLGAIERELEWPEHTVRCMALVESFAFAFACEEFAYNLRDRIVGLNFGRWDYIASCLEYWGRDANRVLPDRNAIPHDAPFLQAVRGHIVNTCHRHGIFAIGGMTALFPDVDEALGVAAAENLAADKANESAMGFDGAWTGHPGQNDIAVAAFPEPNQLSFMHDELGDRPDLCPAFLSPGFSTYGGLVEAARTATLYWAGTMHGLGAVLLPGMDGRSRMEDRATYRICASQIAQRLATGITVHTAEDEAVVDADMVGTAFAEALEIILDEDRPRWAASDFDDVVREASVIVQLRIVAGELMPA